MTTKIEWTNKSWNPVRGCRRVSPGCENCYAERVAIRQSNPGGAYEGLVKSHPGGPRWTGDVRTVPEKLREPIGWRKPQRVFVNSMSDLFHEDVDPEFVAAVFGVMAAADHHMYQVLTKRPVRMRTWFEWLDRVSAPLGASERQLAAANDYRIDPTRHAMYCVDAAERIGALTTDLASATRASAPWPLYNLWLGVSCEDQQRADERIPALLQCPADVRFVSAEPLLGPIDLEHVQWPKRHKVDVLRGGFWEDGVGFTQHSDMNTLDWIIVGGESGPNARRFKTEWGRAIVKQCEQSSVACFVKQLGANVDAMSESDVLQRTTRMKLRDRKGGNPDEWPADLRVRDYPPP